MRFTNTIIPALLAGSAAAHPGHSVTEELQERRDFLAKTQVRDLSHCSDKLKARGIEARNIARRERTAEAARTKRGLKSKRDIDTVLATDHNATGLGYTVNSTPDSLFTSNASCILTPDVTQGPYYVGGEYIRRDVREDQEGIDTIIDYQVIDVNTCDPVPNVYLEMWHCNSTGVYSGVSASGNGDSSDTGNLNNTFLRGIWPTDSDGVAQFETTFPGHYTSRATHIHILIHTNATVYPNGTLGNEVTASHVGQAFFDQDLIYLADEIAPYSDNTQEITTNADDSIMSEEAATDGVDPVFEYTYLSDDLADGLFAWIAFGINATESSTVTPAAFYYESGGVENENSSMGGGGGSPPGSSNSTSSGSAPSGSASAAATKKRTC
ncbi:Catechol 1,2-dioxygenase [Cytospora mali]|uniref:Catechol 1,2-dioxygenase n=1 Tax=Cytospora mali TaxID=578113 RepID=A0A194V5H6_CYTMA|nr:Catechol 1,2-dioxygenase [Valsa mali var. pyri (nom. inval.)]